MAMPEPTDAEWATIDTRFMLAFRRVRRERETAVNARDGLQGDYDTICTELQRIHTTAATEAAARTDIEAQVVSARAEVASLEQRLLEAHQEKEATVASLKAEMEMVLEKQNVEREGREHDLSTRLEQAEATARQAALELAQERKDMEETVKRLEGQRDEARAGENRAISERVELQGMVGDKDMELDAVRAELKAKQLPAEVIIVTDDEDEAPAPISRTYLKSSALPSETAVKANPALPAPAPSTNRNATPGPGPSTLNNRNKSTKRSAEDSDSDVLALPLPRKRARKTIRGVVDDARTLLNQRVATMRSIALTRIYAHKLPAPVDPTVGWVKRALFVREYDAHAESWITHLDIMASLVSINNSSTGLGDKQSNKHPALFLDLDEHPGLPTYPGQPGTMISNGVNIPLDEPILVVVVSGKLGCQYVGKYILRRDQRGVECKEWRSMPDATRRVWRARLHACGPTYLSVSMRLAYSARRHRRITDKELQIVLTGWEKAKADNNIKKRMEMRPTYDEIDTGLLKFYDTLGVVTMEPISVDERLYEEIWNKHLAGDCYGKVDGKKPEKMPESKASATATSQAPSKSSEEIAPSNDRLLLESFASRCASTSSTSTAGSGLRRSSRAPVQRVGVLAGFDAGHLQSEDEQQQGSDSDFIGTDACDEM